MMDVGVQEDRQQVAVLQSGAPLGLKSRTFLIS